LLSSAYTTYSETTNWSTVHTTADNHRV